MDLIQYRLSPSEQARTNDLRDLLPRGRYSILEIGARDGHFTQVFTEFFPQVTALDLTRPSFELPGVTTVQGNACRLEFPDNHFDCVICTEVLEHIPDLQQAADEISRVAAHEVIIGVPFDQDLRVGRTTCGKCGQINPPYAHLNTFTQSNLEAIFSGLEPVKTSFVWSNKDRTNALSCWLLDRAGNPWGTYEQDEPCLSCGSPLGQARAMNPVQKGLARLSVTIQSMKTRRIEPRPTWIHIVFRKNFGKRSPVCAGSVYKTP